jgi:hypothetical protein
MTTNLAKKWIAAGSLLAADPLATVRCPERDDGVLLVRDKLAPDGLHVIERFIVCETCGASNAIRMGPGERGEAS